jgi:protein-tyrosine phosphatase
VRTRRKQEGEVPDPRTRWDEISGGLWMGGHVWIDGAERKRPVVVNHEFDLVVSLFTQEGHGPPPGVEHRILAIPDEPLTARDIDRVRELAVLAAEAVRDRRAVLVRCHAGYNRSGLVIAQTLIEMGLDAQDAIDRVRRRRSPWALHNEIFEQYLLTGLDVAALLTDLEPPLL